MSESIDVLAVMDAALSRLWNSIPIRQVWTKDQLDADEQLKEARAAIAELIEAAAEVRAAHRELPSTDYPAEVRQAGEARIGRAHYALEAALARVRGSA